VLYKLQNRNRLPFLDLQKQLITYRDKENALARRMAGEDLPAPGDAKADFARVICKACAYDRKDRYQSPGEFREALEEIRYRRKHPGAVQRQPDIQAVRPEAVSPEPVRSEPVRPEPVSRPVNREYRQKTPQPVQRPAERTPSRNSARRRKKKKGTTRLLIAVTLMAFAVLIVGVLFVRLLIRKSDSSGVNGNYVQMESAKGDELTQELNQIQEQATTIVNNLSNYNWIGSEAEGRISYLDENGTVMKILIYPSLSAEGYYEEYYYWDGELFFAYIWADENTLPYLEEGEQKVNLYYYKDDELIRWIDDNNRCHDLETDNEEYVNRGEKYLSQAKEYASRLSVEEGAG
jgi:serine/threonine-protein kinase